MPFSFACPHCGVVTTVDEEYAGQTGPCRSCRKSVTIPNPVAGIAPAAASKNTVVPVLVITLVAVGVIALGVVGLLMALLLPAVSSAREAARRSQCNNCLKQIALAMHNYHDTYRCFPPAYIADENGKPMHSWRTLLLPFMEQQALYGQYDFSKPWDSPENRAATNHIVEVYRCPSATGTSPTETNYMVVTGSETMFDADKAAVMGSVKDGLSNTLLVVEVSGTGVSWAEPKDLPASSLQAGAGIRLGGNHPAGFNAALGDGSVRFVETTIPPDTLKALSTKAGGEATPPF